MSYVKTNYKIFISSDIRSILFHKCILHRLDTEIEISKIVIQDFVYRHFLYTEAIIA